ncbi:MAG: uroporphyrinogen-III synthase [Methanomassiliicoccales archaeon PtaB.Bin215]|nr:MAG: uroporphyrinogen-III synthase [Methanomassiliicoccales archaeon PtaB.Bin215]
MSVVLVLRPKDRWKDSRSLVEASGHHALCASVVEVAYLTPPELPAVLDAVRNGEFQSMAFASVTAVKALSRVLPDLIRAIPPEIELVAIGPPTARALQELGAKDVAVPDEYTSEGLVSHLARGKGNVLMLRSDQGNDVLRLGLQGRRGLMELAIYSLREGSDDSLGKALDELRSGNVDAVLHTSSLSARLLVQSYRDRFGHDAEWNAINAAIGPPTRDTLASMGLKVQVMARQATFPDLVKAVEERLRQSN